MLPLNRAFLETLCLKSITWMVGTDGRCPSPVTVSDGWNLMTALQSHCACSPLYVSWVCASAKFEFLLLSFIYDFFFSGGPISSKKRGKKGRRYKISVRDPFNVLTQPLTMRYCFTLALSSERNTFSVERSCCRGTPCHQSSQLWFVYQ